MPRSSVHPHSTAVLLLTLALGACADRAESAPAFAGKARATETRDMPAREPETRKNELADAEKAVAERKVIRSARLEIRADDPAAAAQDAMRIVERAGGFVASSHHSGVGEAVERVDMRLRVPAARFEPTLGELRDGGELLVESLTGEDVTESYTDLSARLRSQSALEERLLAILAQATTVDDVLKVETQLVAVRTEVERLTGALRVMDDRVGLATIELVLAAPVRHERRDAESVTSRLDRALDDAGELCVGAFAGMIRFVGATLPIGIVVLPIGLAVRRGWRRRRAAQAALARAQRRADEPVAPR
jgi:hypothetical protein